MFATVHAFPESWLQGLQTLIQWNNLSRTKKKKTQQNVALLEEFLTLRNESRHIEEIAPKELNAYITEFIITVRKKDGNEDYEPSSLRSLMASFERYLKKKNYGFSIMKDAEFEQARKALQSKEKAINLTLQSLSQKRK